MSHIYFTRGVSLSNSGDEDNAVKWYQKAIENHPTKCTQYLRSTVGSDNLLEYVKRWTGFELDLRECKINNFKEIMSLGNAITSNESIANLEYLLVGYNSLGDPGGIELASILSHVNAPRLFHLDIAGNNLSDESFVPIANSILKNVQNLEFLRAENNRIGPMGGTVMATVIKCHKALKKVHLFVNKLGVEGCNAILNVASKLEMVTLQDNDFKFTMTVLATLNTSNMKDICFGNNMVFFTEAPNNQ